MELASVVLDIPTRSLEAPFSYLIPENLKGQVAVGSLVVVPFSNRLSLGYVVALESSSTYQETPSGFLEGRSSCQENSSSYQENSSSLQETRSSYRESSSAHQEINPVSGKSEDDRNPSCSKQNFSTNDKSYLSKLKEIKEVVGSPVFDEAHACLGLWLAKTYAAPLNSVFRLFLPPGQAQKITEAKRGGFEEAVKEATVKEEEWVVLSGAYDPFSEVEDSVPKASKEPVIKKNAYKQKEVLEALSSGPQKMSELVALIPGARPAIAALAKKGLLKKVKREHLSSPKAEASLSSATAQRPQVLTKGQKNALLAIEKAAKNADGEAVLVKGITGSGKSEVYLEAIENIRAKNQSAIVLVPEISLTAQTVGRFRSRFGDDIAVFHSRLTTSEKLAQWTRIKQGRAHVVIGARSALFAPVHNLGLIVIDEEHETSYKQDQTPRYVARDVAKKLAEITHATLVLGSATPSMEALYNAKVKEDWSLTVMDERPGKAVLPRIEIIDMRKALKEKGATQAFSNDLRCAIIDTYNRGEKSVLLLNRRGFASFLMCEECGCVPECPHCSTSLTYHERTHELACHTCGRTWSLGYGENALTCPACGSSYLSALGMGTQRVEDEISLFLPDAPVFRMDADTTKKRGAHEEILEAFDAMDGSILLGTQMIAKGLDFSDVTLVGVINADTTLKLPDFRAPEKTFNLLEQVAGRAGRGERPGRVFIQTYWAAHPAIKEVAKKDRTKFEEAEEAIRKESFYPPFSRLGNIIVVSSNSHQAEKVVNQFAAALSQEVAQKSNWQVLGPAPCLKAKVKDRFRFHVLLKAPPEAEIGPVLSRISKKIDTKGVSVQLDVDAYNMF